MMKQFIAKIVSHAQVSDCFYELTFEWDGRAGVPLPGQFCTIRVSPLSTPLLRRPFAFSAYDPETGHATILYKIRGPATELLAAKAAGGELDVIGPLGTDFFSASDGALESPLCVAGGTGFGPMLFLFSECKKKGGKPALGLGCRTASQLPALNATTGLAPFITTDDGSRGKKGTPLEYLSELQKENPNIGALCVCGPVPLMQGCHEWSRKQGLPCYVSFEQTMACGVGACMGCAVKTAGGGYARACTDGPVFESTRIAWTSA
ncbi:MAG TPA: dihydroorotate dehydrogenase electron transfer subunit [Chitinivibrionales bacterium]|nr:dihydroorotate dehydrogenase electron transfer subunit [Chitinivibrionales bacterium]